MKSSFMIWFLGESVWTKDIYIVIITRFALLTTSLCDLKEITPLRFSFHTGRIWIITNSLSSC